MGLATGKIIATIGKKVVQEPEKAGNIVYTIIIGVLAIFLFINGVLSSLVGCFSGSKLDTQFNARDTQAYKIMQGIFNEYVQELNRQMDAMEAQIIEDNTYEEITYTYTEHEETIYEREWVYDDKFDIWYWEMVEKKVTWTEEHEHKEEKCDVVVSRQINQINFAYMMAYVNITEPDVLKGKGIQNISREKVKDYLEQITTIETSEPEKNQVLLYNRVLGVDEIASLYFSTDQNSYQMFLLSFDLYVSFLGDDNLIVGGGYDGEIEPILHGTGLSVPHYFQTDYKNTRYGNGTIAQNGCAPTCIAMVASYLTSSEVSPVDVVNYTGNKFYVTGAGSSWGIFSYCAARWNIQCKEIGISQNTIIKELEKGNPVVVSMRPGTFTKSGHFLVIRGVTKDGYFLVNDPNRANYNKYNTDRFSCKLVLKEAKGGWSFYK